MVTVKIRELKNRLSHYLGIVRGGETVIVLDRNAPIAEIRARSTSLSSERIDRYITELTARGLLTPATTDSVLNFEELFRKARISKPRGDWRPTLNEQREERFT